MCDWPEPRFQDAGGFQIDILEAPCNQFGAKLVLEAQELGLEWMRVADCFFCCASRRERLANFNSRSVECLAISDRYATVFGQSGRLCVMLSPLGLSCGLLAPPFLKVAMCSLGVR
jgi:hypothetical protein